MPPLDAYFTERAATYAAIIIQAYARLATIIVAAYYYLAYTYAIMLLSPYTYDIAAGCKSAATGMPR